MLLEAFEALEAFGLDELFVDEESGESLLERPLGDFGVEAFARADDRREQGNRALLQVASDRVFDGGERLLFDRHLAVRAVLDAAMSGHLPPTAFVSFIQNHDQIGNRALGDRIMAVSPADAVKAVTSIYLLAPEVPMLFMGEEWGADEPFPFFCDFDEDLNDKVRKGRREELSRLPGFDAGELLDPTAPSTFAAAKLDWEQLASSETLDFYRMLLGLRRQRIIPLLIGAAGRATFQSAGTAVAVAWTLAGNRRLHLTANLSDEAARLGHRHEDGETIFRLGRNDDGDLAPWTVIWSIGKA